MVYKFFDSKVASPDKKSVGSGPKLIPQNEQLADELHKPIIRKFKKRKVYSAFKDNIWGADLADMQLLSKYNKGIRFLSCVIEIAGLTKNTVDNLADITKLKAIDTNSFVTRTKFSADSNTLDDKIDGVEKKMPDISGLTTKTSLNAYLQTSTFNSKVTEVENKTKDADIIAKSAVTKANTIRSDLTDYAKKADVTTDITTIKNDYVSNASLTSRLNELNSQHISTEVKTIDDKTKKNRVIFKV